MHDDIRVTLKALMPTPQGVGIFLSDGAKVISIFVDPYVASAISLFAQGRRAPRPLTHELLQAILTGLGAQVVKVVISELKDETYYARLFLRQENELGRHLLEVDARPSDSIALAVAQKCPIFVRPEVWARAEDMAWALEQAERAAREAGETPEPPDDEPGFDAGAQSS
jgi:uncharacterized protein